MADTKRKSKPSISPQHLPGQPHAWYYEDRSGITVVVEARDRAGRYLGVTMQPRIPWSLLLKSASRCASKESKE
jgi:hypothetical protein